MDVFGNSAAFDQMDAAMRDLALICKNHYNRCIEAGFTEEHALRMVIGLQESIVRGGMSK